MEINRFIIYTYLFVFICINNSKISCLNSLIKHNNENKIINNNDNELYKLRNLEVTCNIKYCLKCENRNECIKCKNEYELVDKRCYSKNCEIFGFCKYCDEYDCLKCHKGYKLNFGICEIKESSKKLLILKVCIIIIIIILLVYLYIYKKRKAREKIETGQVIKFSHPKPGFYRLNFEKFNLKNNEEFQDFSQNRSLSSSNSDSTGDRETPVVNSCVVCGSKKLYAIADCGCSVCLDDYRIIKGEKERIKCRVHNVFLSSNITFEMYKSNIKGNAVEKLGLAKCPICKINDGTQSFNCGCPMKLCEKCFNDNVYVFKYNECPGCGKTYVPLKKTKKKKKSHDETMSNQETI